MVLLFQVETDIEKEEWTSKERSKQKFRYMSHLGSVRLTVLEVNEIAKWILLIAIYMLTITPRFILPTFCKVGHIAIFSA